MSYDGFALCLLLPLIYFIDTGLSCLLLPPSLLPSLSYITGYIGSSVRGVGLRQPVSRPQFLPSECMPVIVFRGLVCVSSCVGFFNVFLL